MAYKFADIAFTPTVKALQDKAGSRSSYEKMEAAATDRGAAIGPSEAEFLAHRDSFYMATVSETGWPYVQHRGGPAGFVRVLDDHTIGFADFAGNRQYVSVGNLLSNDRVSLFFMDYVHKARLKLLGRVRLVDRADPAMLAKLTVPGTRARVERGFVIAVEAVDWNCPQHITPRFTEADVMQVVEPLRQRITELEAQLTQARISNPPQC